MGENVVFPSDMGVINIKTAYGANSAKGDGTTDDTAAIQNAINIDGGKYKIFYFPNGTYLVSNTIQFGAWNIFVGQSEAGTIIKLKNNCSGFGIGANKPVIQSYVARIPHLTDIVFRVNW